MHWPKTIKVTEQNIDISFLDKKQLTYYEELGSRLHQKYLRQGKGRQLFTLSGPPGAGKSVITALLEHYFSQFTDFDFINLGLDAFHYQNNTLKEMGIINRKGGPGTYNINLLIDKLTAFVLGKNIKLPIYSRLSHEPVRDQLLVGRADTLILLEVQWLLLNKPAWMGVQILSKHNMFITGPTQKLRKNVINRHIKGGRTPEESANYYDQNDQANAILIANNHNEPDERLLYYDEITTLNKREEWCG